MFWIKDCDGDLVNLARMTNIYCEMPETEGEPWTVQVEDVDGQLTLFFGTREECGRFRDDLLRQLKERENKWNMVDVVIDRT